MDNKIITKKQAKEQGLIHYFTGKACKRNHLDKRFLIGGACVSCKLQDARVYYSKYKNQQRKYRKELYRKNPELQRIRNKRFAKKHPEKLKALNALRRATKLLATPLWVNPLEIEIIYKNCPKGYHVDHIIPLNPRCKTVCGLHVPWNLIAIPASENRSKSDVYWPGQWEKTNP